jgi:NitT/TauT family transport system substrate-binding protein
VDVMQSAVSSHWPLLDQGRTGLPVHFAQINQRDGFFLVSREAGLAWRELPGRRILADHGAQPLAMLKYAVHVQGLDWSSLHVSDAGTPDAMEAAFRAGHGDVVHLQGPAAQRLEGDQDGTIIASVGESMPPVAFSSLMAMPDFLGTPAAAAFLRAYEQARHSALTLPPAALAGQEARFFPETPHGVLAAAIARYQSLGCWAGDLTIPRDLYEQSLTVFEHSGLIARRHPYEAVVAPPR